MDKGFTTLQKIRIAQGDGTSISLIIPISAMISEVIVNGDPVKIYPMAPVITSEFKAGTGLVHYATVTFYMDADFITVSGVYEFNPIIKLQVLCANS